MSATLVLGIDPGQAQASPGAVCLLVDSQIDEVTDMTDLPPTGIGSWIRDWVDGLNVTLAVVEAQAGMPGQSSSSTAKFHAHYGALCGALSALHIPIELARPTAWKKHYGLSKDKNASRALAAARWPEWAPSFARKRDDGRAEAALIGLYGIERREATT